jgi:membrane dipeptidase
LEVSLDRRPPDYHYCQAMAIFIPEKLQGARAREYFGAVYQCYERQLVAHSREMNRVTDLSRIDEAIERCPFAAFLTVENGSVLAGKPEYVRELYQLGVRMMTITWNTGNELCGGNATDRGFSPEGRAAIREMEKSGMVVDVSHMSDRGFWELCGFAERPFIASHSNSRAVCDHPRNLTDDMFREIRDRGGLVGLNYHNAFIVREGRSASIEDLLRHTHHFLELGGEDVIALGSDFDGADIPEYLNSIEKTAFLLEEMERSGIPAAVVEKIRYANAQRFFEGFAEKDADRRGGVAPSVPCAL